MADRHIFPRDIHEFNDYILVCFQRLIAYQGRLFVSDDNLFDLMELMDKWSPNWDSYNDPNKCTKTVNHLKDSLRLLLEKALRTIYKDIPNSAFSPVDRSIFNVKGASLESGHKIYVVLYAPSIAMERVAHLSHTLRFDDPEHPKSGGMPEGHNIFLERYLSEKVLKNADIPFTDGRKVTRELFSIIYTAEDVGKTAYYCAYYENTTGERSVQSYIISAIII